MNVFEYIEKLAEKHVDVRHVPGTEIHFLGSDNEKYTSIPSELNYPAVILDKASEFGFSGTTVSISKDKGYLLFILQHVDDTSDYKQIEQAFELTETILAEFLQRFIADKRNKETTFLMQFSIVDVECEYIENIDNALYGVLAYLNFPEIFPQKLCREAFIND